MTSMGKSVADIFSIFTGGVIICINIYSLVGHCKRNKQDVLGAETFVFT